jgi:ribosomal protein S18 acetylase RimI-like enzyme
MRQRNNRAELMTHSELVLRRAHMADAGTIANFNLAMALETENKNLIPEVVAAGVAAIVAEPGRGFYLLAERAGTVVGGLMITYEWSDWRNADFWWIQSVYVRPDARRQGVYAALYRDIEAQAKSAGACGIRLYVENDNRNAMETYSRLGMEDAHYRVMERSFV